MRRHFICIKWFSFGDIDNELGKECHCWFFRKNIDSALPAESSLQKADSHKVKSWKQCKSKNRKNLMDSVRIPLFCNPCMILWYIYFLGWLHCRASSTNKTHLCALPFFLINKTNSNIMMKFSNSFPTKYKFQWNYSITIWQY